MDITKQTSYKEEVLSQYNSLLRIAKKDLGKEDVNYLRKAFNLALDSTKGKKSERGISFIIVPLAVAKIVSQELNLGLPAVLAALLYPFVQEGLITEVDLKKNFPSQIGKIIQELLKISRIQTSKLPNQVDNFRKLIISLTTDPRVILIKLAERLEEMRAIDAYPEEKRIRAASENFDLYAPLAHRLGLYLLKSELEDLSLKYIEPEVYKDIEQKLIDSKAKRDKLIRDFIKPIKETLTNQGYSFDIKGRLKSITSIWNKMRKQNVEFEEVYDKFAIRIILNSAPEKEKSDCWQAFSIVTDFYQPNPKRMRDWVSVPKSNGYESLHTTVVIPGGQWVEVQIRTERMNEIAEKGFAAHWKYKGIEKDQNIDDWLNRIREVLKLL